MTVQNPEPDPNEAGIQSTGNLLPVLLSWLLLSDGLGI